MTKMDSLRCAAVCFLMTLCLFTTGEADDNPDCQYRHFQLEECIMEAKFRFDRLDRSSYKRKLCRGARPVIECLTRHRGECPDIKTFQGKSGQAVDQMMDSYAQICVEGHPSPPSQPGASEQGSCEGSRRKFRKRMGKCHETEAYKEHQMCKPLKKTIRCMGRQLNKFRTCSWMRESAARQVEFGVSYMTAVRAVRYGCE